MPLKKLLREINDSLNAGISIHPNCDIHNELKKYLVPKLKKKVIRNGKENNFFSSWCDLIEKI